MSFLLKCFWRQNLCEEMRECECRIARPYEMFIRASSRRSKSSRINSAPLILHDTPATVIRDMSISDGQSHTVPPLS